MVHCSLGGHLRKDSPMSKAVDVGGKSWEAGGLLPRKCGHYEGNCGNGREICFFVHENTERIVENFTPFLGNKLFASPGCGEGWVEESEASYFVLQPS